MSTPSPYDSHGKQHQQVETPELIVAVPDPAAWLCAYWAGRDESTVDGVELLRAYGQATVEAQSAELDKLRSKLATADAYFPKAALETVNAQERAETAERTLAEQAAEIAALKQKVAELERILDDVKDEIR